MLQIRVSQLTIHGRASFSERIHIQILTSQVSKIQAVCFTPIHNSQMFMQWTIIGYAFCGKHQELLERLLLVGWSIC